MVARCHYGYARWLTKRNTFDLMREAAGNDKFPHTNSYHASGLRVNVNVKSLRSFQRHSVFVPV